MFIRMTVAASWVSLRINLCLGMSVRFLGAGVTLAHPRKIRSFKDRQEGRQYTRVSLSNLEDEGLNSKVHW